MAISNTRSGILYFLLVTCACFLATGLNGQNLAFPGAEGFGKFTSGGRGGDVYHVTNLDDFGVGSLRYGIEEMSGPTTIVFDVSGTIMLQGKLEIKEENLTIAGQTAPGDGITIANKAFIVKANNVIVRYIRVRLGDQSGGDDDAISITRGKHIILDHVTASWSIDETLSCQSEEVDSLTVQWCMVTESLNDSHHAKGEHGYGGIIGSIRQSFHHNLYAHHKSRTPKVTWRRHTQVDFRNNVIYNWGSNNCYDGTTGYMNWVNNYYKAGPATKRSVADQIFNLSDEDVGDYMLYETSLYAEGNYVESYPLITMDNWNGGITFYDGANEADHRKLTPHNFVPIDEDSAQGAYPVVVAEAGASIVRDIIDTRIANEVLTGTAMYTGSKTGLRGIIDAQSDVGGWPALPVKFRGGNFDTDQDGMADEWEMTNNLNTNDAGDRNGYTLHNDYTNLEVYLNDIITNPITTGISDGNNIAQGGIRCFPNPTKNSFTVELENINRPSLEVLDFYGRVVFAKQLHENSNHIVIEGLQSGMYLVIVNGGEQGTYIEKMMVIK